MDKKQQNIETYDKSATQMAQKFNSFGAREDDIKTGLKYLKKNNPKIVEIGCGNGREAKVFLKYTSNYLGIDISKSMIELAKNTAPKAKFEIADLENYNFPAQTDAIFAFAAIVHSDKKALKNLFKNAAKSQKKGSIFFLNFKFGEYRSYDKTDEFGTRHYFYYTPKLVERFAGNDYKTVYTKKYSLRGQDWVDMVLEKT